ncbi:hypothetical protein BD779DRAFT_1561236 [Infundibulicybe gibba]|nr:hypothetical protein BD779DRAFT_1561236 [Infundibulicybe gibba]
MSASVHLTAAPRVGLPRELVIKIFLCAVQSSTSCCLALCAVSTWARHIALPHLYTTVLINHTSAELFLSTTAIPLPADFVRHLWADCSRSQLLTIIPRCRNISHITIPSSGFRSFAEPPLLEYFSAGGGGGCDIHVLMPHHFPQYERPPSQHPHGIQLFDRITHLRLTQPVDLRMELFVGYMRRLTHLAVLCGDADVRDLAYMLPVVQDSSIEVFVLVLSGEHLSVNQSQEVEKWVRETRRVEERIYVVRPLCDKVKEEWEVEVRGGGTIWERALEYTHQLMNHRNSRTE